MLFLIINLILNSTQLKSNQQPDLNHYLYNDRMHQWLI